MAYITREGHHSVGIGRISSEIDGTWSAPSILAFAGGAVLGAPNENLREVPDI